MCQKRALNNYEISKHYTISSGNCSKNSRITLAAPHIIALFCFFSPLFGWFSVTIDSSPWVTTPKHSESSTQPPSAAWPSVSGSTQSLWKTPGCQILATQYNGIFLIHALVLLHQIYVLFYSVLFALLYMLAFGSFPAKSLYWHPSFSYGCP